MLPGGRPTSGGRCPGGLPLGGLDPGGLNPGGLDPGGRDAPGRLPTMGFVKSPGRLGRTPGSGRDGLLIGRMEGRPGLTAGREGRGTAPRDGRGRGTVPIDGLGLGFAIPWGLGLGFAIPWGLGPGFAIPEGLGRATLPADGLECFVLAPAGRFPLGCPWNPPALASLLASAISGKKLNCSARSGDTPTPIMNAKKPANICLVNRIYSLPVSGAGSLE